MAKKTRLKRILEEREKQQNQANTTGNIRTISTGLPSTRQNIVIPKNTLQRVQKTAEQIYSQNKGISTTFASANKVDENAINLLRNNTTSKESKALATYMSKGNTNQNLNEKQNKQNVIANYNEKYRQIQSGSKTKASTEEEKYLDRIKKEKDPKKQLKMTAVYNDITGEDKTTFQINKEAKDEKTINKINNGNTAEKVFNSAKFMLQGTAEGAIGTLGQINATAQNISRNTNYNKVKKMQEYASSYQQNLQNVDNGLVRFGGQVTNTVGGMIPSIAMNMIAPGTGSIVAGVSAGSGAYLETLHENQDNKGKAMLTGVL